MEHKLVIEEESIDNAGCETEESLGEFSPAGLNPQDFLKIINTNINHSAAADIGFRPVFYEIGKSLSDEEILKAITSAIRSGVFNIVLTERNYEKLPDETKQLFHQR